MHPAPNDAREEFQGILSDVFELPTVESPAVRTLADPEVRRVLTSLRSCSDIVPALTCEQADEPAGLTYSQLACRLLRRPAKPGPETDVWVTRQWDDHRYARYRLDDLSGIQWARTSGGVHAVANRPYVHAIVSCEGMQEGELAHSCSHGPGPHNIRVCITAGRNGGSRSPLMRHLRHLASA